MPPPCVLFCRPRLLIRALALAGVTLAGGEAMGQLGYSYSWAQRYGSNDSTRSDYGRGVAVLTDGVGNQAVGTVVSVGEYTGIYAGGLGTARRKAYTTFVTPLVGGGFGTWSRQFQEVSNAEVSAYGVAVNPPDLEGSRRHAFVVGWFSGQVGFGAPAGNKTATNLKDAFVARVDADTQSTDWVTCFTGTGDQACLAVAAGPPCGGGAGIASTETVRYYRCGLDGTAPTLLAVGGYFTTEIQFPYADGLRTETAPMNTGENAFLALVYSDPDESLEGFVFKHLVLGSTGNDRITALAFDPVDQSIYVTGYFSSNSINFDPNGPAVIKPNAYSGGTDIFVAKYALDHSDNDDLRLLWRCCTGTTGDDSGSGIAVDAAGNAYACGWKYSGGARDIWVARYPRAVGCQIVGPLDLVVQNWSLQYTATGDQAANGIALDGLDRVLVTGQFAGTVDFNRGPGVDNRTSAGGQDIFITRLSPVDSAYLGTYTFGSTKDDVGAAIAVDPVQSMRLAHAGYFGEVDAGINYSVDFDPNAPVANLTSKGKADGYASSLVPQFPTGVQTQVTLVLDRSNSVTPPEYQAMVDAYNTAILAKNPDGKDIVPTNGKTALNVVFYGASSTYKAVEGMPWTVIDSPTTATLFANKLRNHARRDAVDNFIDEALWLAESSHQRAANLGLDACHHVLSVVSDGRNYVEIPEPPLYPDGRGAPELQTAVFGPNGILASAFIDQIDGFAAKPEATRDFYLTYMAGSDVNNPSMVGFALETPQPADGFLDADFVTYLMKMLGRETHCPGDYDLDGSVNGTDLSKFGSDYNAANLRADLDFNGAVTPADLDMFNAAYGIGCCP